MKSSVIIPVYNGEKYIEKCLRSLLLQNTDDFEIIIVDDGSCDNSLQRCKELLCSRNNVTIIHQLNQGVSSARNTGINQAHGDYVLFIDCDDFVEQDYISTMTEGAADFDWVFSGINDFCENRELAPFKYMDNIYDFKYESDYFSFIHLGLFNAPFPKLYKREIIINNGIRFNTNISLAEDREFNLQYLHYVRRVKTLDYIGYNYRSDTPGSLSKTMPINSLPVNYNHWLLEKKSFEKNGFVGVRTKTYLANKLFNIIIDELYYHGYKALSETSFDYSFLSQNRENIQSSKWLKYLILNRKYSVAQCILRIKQVL